MKIALLLIVLGLGYKVFADANKEQGSLRTVGRIIGLIMIVTSIAAGTLKIAKCAAMAGFCPMKSACGFSSCPGMK